MTGTSTDVVVVGARCSGAALATLLARRGVDVLVLDKARFPSDIASTHIVHPAGVAVLDRLGALAALREAGAGRIERLLLAYDDARLEADYTSPPAQASLTGGRHAGLSARRVVLDAALQDAARAAGATLRAGVRVTDVLRDAGGRVCGVRADGRDVRARVVVGADGRYSTTAGLVGARDYGCYPPGRLAVWGYFDGARPDHNRLRIGRFGEHAFVATPAERGLMTVGVVPAMAHAHRFRGEGRERAYRDGLRDWPELDGLVAGATRVGPLRTVADWRGYQRVSAGPGWVLTGDAGTFKDPAAAQGITDALRQAERLADTLERALHSPGGDAALDAATREWWRWRDADCRAMHWFAADMGAAGPTRPVTAQLVRDAAGDEQAALRWLQVLNRDVTPARLLTWPRRARAVTGALRHGGPVTAVAGEVGAVLTAEAARALRGRVDAYRVSAPRGTRRGRSPDRPVPAR